MSQIPRKSFEVIYKKLALPLAKFVIKRVGGDSRAVDEVLSSTMVAGWKGWHTFKHKSSYFTWLCRIALNKIADYYHDQINENSHLVVPAIERLINTKSNEISPEEKLSLDELKKSVNDCLNLLPYEKRRLLWFRYWEDLSHAQIAKILGTSRRAIEGKLYRAKKAFRKIFTFEPFYVENSQRRN